MESRHIKLIPDYSICHAKYNPDPNCKDERKLHGLKTNDANSCKITFQKCQEIVKATTESGMDNLEAIFEKMIIHLRHLFHSTLFLIYFSCCTVLYYTVLYCTIL